MSDQGGFTSGDPLGESAPREQRVGTDAFGRPIEPPPRAPLPTRPATTGPGAYGGGPVPPGALAPTTPAPDPFGAPRSPFVLASWGKRAVAAIVDGLLIAVIAFVLFAIVTGVGINSDGSDGFAALIISFLIALLVFTLAALLYQPLMLWKTDGQTVGKKMTGIRVVKADRTPMDLGTAVLREIVLKSIAVGIVSSFTFGLAYLADWFWPFFDDQNRALHDFLVDTRVVDA